MLQRGTPQSTTSASALVHVSVQGILVCALALLWSAPLHAETPPTVGFSAAIGELEFDQSHGIVTDAAGNSYTTGQFSGAPDFDPTQGVDVHRAHEGSWDVFVTKLHPDGSYGWTMTLGAEGHDVGRAIALDRDGNLFVAGEFAHPGMAYYGYRMDFDPTAHEDVHETRGYTDVFVTKFLADGTYAWTRTVGGEYEERLWDLAVDADGNILVTGSFMGTVDFDPTDGVDEHIEPTRLAGDVFMTKLYPDGSYCWTRTFGGPHADEGRGLAVDAHGNIFVTGFFEGYLDVWGWGPLAWHGGTDLFVTQLSPDGAYRWFHTVGGATHDGGRGIAVDADGQVMVTGYVSETADLDPTEGRDLQTSAGGPDIVAIALRGDGSYRWGRVLGGLGDDRGADVALDAHGDVFLSGQFEGIVDFAAGQDPTAVRQARGGADIFVSKLDADGRSLWTYAVGGSGGDDIARIALDASGNALVTGGFQHAVQFDTPQAMELRTAGGQTDVFIVKLVVEPRNRAPEFLGLETHLRVDVGQAVSEEFRVVDADGDSLHLRVSATSSSEVLPELEILSEGHGWLEARLRWDGGTPHTPRTPHLFVLEARDQQDAVTIETIEISVNQFAASSTGRFAD